VDISNLDTDEYSEFAESALRKRGENLPAKTKINLATIEELLISASRAFPLVTIHREEFDPDVCYIGRVVAVVGGELRLLEIGPDATWDLEPTSYYVNEITHVNFGGDYEDALYLVGGEPTTN
jgi:hypothetical protein